MRFFDRGKLQQTCTPADSKINRFFLFLYTLTFLVVLPIICFDRHHSFYNFRRKSISAEMGQMKNDNDQRLVKSRRIINEYSKFLTRHSESDALLQPRNPHVGITVITVSRNRNFRGGYQPQYLTQVVGRLLDLINVTTTKLKYNVFVCNVDSQPEAYEELFTLKHLFPVFQKYKVKNTTFRNIFEKEKLDYIYCIEETLSRNVSFAFMIEDDAYPHEDLFPVLEKIIDHTEKRNTVQKNVSFVKFYHPERLLGYISLERERLVELIAFGFVFGSLLTLFCQHFVVTSERKLSNIWIKSIIYFCLVALIVGRVNLIELRRFSAHTYQLTPTPSCCTQAMLFPRDSARNMVHHLKKVWCYQSYGKDIALEDIRARERYDALMVQPNLFTHNGLYSTVRRGMVNPFLLE